MQLSIEISFYPLTEGYEACVLNFIADVRRTESIQVEVNGMSTQLFGEDTILMPCLHQAIVKSLDDQKGMFVLKIGKGTLKLDKPI